MDVETADQAYIVFRGGVMEVYRQKGDVHPALLGALELRGALHPREPSNHGQEGVGDSQRLTCPDFGYGA